MRNNTAKKKIWETRQLNFDAEKIMVMLKENYLSYVQTLMSLE